MSSIFFPSALVQAASGSSMESAGKEASVLFIGNSLTFWNKGIFKHIAPMGPFVCDSETIGGATLRVHMKNGGAMKAISAGHFARAFDFVVLQDDLPEYASQDEARAEFHSLGEQFVTAARTAGATPVMYMAWPYARLPGMPLELLVELHRGLAKKTGVAVAPVGIAFGLATERAASVGQSADYLLDHDKEHPSAAGTFLATIVIFRAITGRDAGPDVGLAQRPLKGNVPPKVEAMLRQVAKEAAATWEAGS